MSSASTAVLAPDKNPSPLTVCFSLQARAEPGVIPRVVELFAKRGLVPHKWHSTVSGPLLTIDLQIGGLEVGLSDYIARCMRQIVGVDTVLSFETHHSG